MAQCGNPRFLPNVVVGDKIGFALDDTVIPYNIRQNAAQGNPMVTPYDYHGIKYSQKLNAWCGFCGDSVILGPFFFESNVNKLSYLEFIEMEILPFRQLCFQSNAGQFQ